MMLLGIMYWCSQFWDIDRVQLCVCVAVVLTFHHEKGQDLLLRVLKGTNQKLHGCPSEHKWKLQIAAQSAALKRANARNHNRTETKAQKQAHKHKKHAWRNHYEKQKQAQTREQAQSQAEKYAKACTSTKKPTRAREKNDTCQRPCTSARERKIKKTSAGEMALTSRHMHTHANTIAHEVRAQYTLTQTQHRRHLHNHKP